MSVPEIGFRIKQVYISRMEKAFCAGKPYKPVKYSVAAVRFNYQHESADIIPDYIHIFGKKFDYANGRIDWHQDIFSGKWFDKIFSKSINIRHNSDLSAKNVWEINRMLFLCFIALNYRHTADERYLERFMAVITSWVQNNPYLIGVNWYSNIEINIRLIVWYFCWLILDAQALLKQNSGFKKFVDKIWMPCIYMHCKYSYANPSKFSSSNNHLISEYAGLYIATTLWQFRHSEKWNTYAKKGLEHEIVRQHSKNGINLEEAAEYIQFITDFFLLSFVAAENAGQTFSDEYKNYLYKILSYIANFIDIQGNFPQYGDEDDGKCILFDHGAGFNNFKSLLTSGAIIYSDAGLKAKSHGMDVKNRVLFGPDGVTLFEEIPCAENGEESVLYPDEGHFILRKRQGPGEIYMHFDAAPLGFLSIAAHGHGDALSFILHIDGQPFLVDPGTYTYHTEPEWRNYFIGTLAHNTVRINKENQARIAGPTLWLDHFQCRILAVESTEHIDRIKAEHNGYQKFGLRHIRDILFNKDENLFLITDEIQSDSSDMYFMEMPFHLHPCLAVGRIEDSGYAIHHPSGGRGLVATIDSQLSHNVINAQTDPEIIGWYSGSFMCKTPTNTILCTLEHTGNVKLTTKIQVMPS